MSVTAACPRVVAHRGLSGLCPENTLPAFAAAVSLGVDEIELDVFRSADGELVVCHDPTIDRTTTGRGRVGDWAWPDLSKLDAGGWFHKDWTGVPLCRLQDVFLQFGDRVVMNVHLKEPGPDGAVVRRTRELAHEHGVCRSIYIAGERDVLEAAVAVAPDLERCCLEGQGDGTIVEQAIAFGCRRVQFWSPHFDDGMIARAHGHGILCNLFYSDDPDEARALYGRGIDAILTNYANRVLPVAGGLRRCSGG